MANDKRPEAHLSGHGRAPVAGGGHPRRRVGVLEGLGGHHAPREVEIRAVELEVLGLPHADDGLDGLSRLILRVLPVDAEGGLLHRGGATGAPLDPARGEDVDGGHLLGHPHRWPEGVGEERHPESQPDLLGDLGERPEHDLGGRAVGAALAEVVLDVPGGLEAQAVGQADLLEGLAVGALLGLALPDGVGPGPWPRDVDLVEQVELHLHRLPRCPAQADRSLSSRGVLGVDRPSGPAGSRLPAGRRGVVPHLVERLVAVGGELPGHPEQRAR